MKYLITLLSLVCSLNCVIGATKPVAIIEGTIEGKKEGDTIQIVIMKYGRGLAEAFKEKFVAKINSNGKIYFEYPGPETMEYIDAEIQLPFRKSSSFLAGSIHIFRGDHVIFKADETGIVFSGPQSRYYNLQRDLYEALLSGFVDYDNIVSQLLICDQKLVKNQALLKNNGTGIDEKRLSLLNAHLVLGNEATKSLFLSLAMGRRKDMEERKKGFNLCIEYKKNYRWAALQIDSLENRGELQRITYYPMYVIDKYRWDSSWLNGKPLDMNAALNFVDKKYSGRTREIILLWLATKNYENLSATLQLAEKRINGKEDFQNYLQIRRTKSFAGQPFFNFSLPEANDKIVKLADLRGKVVLLDFWFTGCGNCRAIHPYLDSIKALIPSDKFELVTVSIDTDKREWLKSISDGLYTTGKNLNLYTGGLGMEHPLIKYYNIHLYPWLILLDKDGKLLDPPTDPRPDKGASLFRQIKTALSN